MWRRRGRKFFLLEKFHYFCIHYLRIFLKFSYFLKVISYQRCESVAQCKYSGRGKDTKILFGLFVRPRFMQVWLILRRSINQDGKNNFNSILQLANSHPCVCYKMVILIMDDLFLSNYLPQKNWNKNFFRSFSLNFLCSLLTLL